MKQFPKVSCKDSDFYSKQFLIRQIADYITAHTDSKLPIQSGGGKVSQKVRHTVNVTYNIVIGSIVVTFHVISCIMRYN